MSGKNPIGEADDGDKAEALAQLCAKLTAGLQGGDHAPKIVVRVPAGKDIQYAGYLNQGLDEHFDAASGIKAYIAQGNPGQLTVWAVRMSEADR